MNLRWLAVACLAAGFGLGCSDGERSSSSRPGTETSRPGMETFRAGLLEHDELERKYLLTSFLRTMRPEEVRPALAEVEKYRTGFDAEEVRLLMLAWTRFDGPGAFATARDWPTPWKSVLMRETLSAWAFNDGRAALTECEQIQDEDLRMSLCEAVVTGWVRSRDRLGASEYAATLSDGKRRSRIALRLAGNAKRDGPEAVIAWADAVPEDAPNGFKATAFSHASAVVARLDPERAAAWYEGRMKHPYTSAGLRSIAGKWAEYHDSKALLAWIETLPIEDARESERTEAVRTIFRVWAPQAPEEAEAWLESAPAGPARDQAIDEFARATYEFAPAEAVLWVGQIADEELRRKRTIRYARRWFALEPAAARKWLAEADIPAEWREQVVNNLPLAASGHDLKNVEPKD
jgi:hypothetical protein